jgi:NADH:ubiquinone oxidoreductase subunit 4 (subunit M)
MFNSFNILETFDITCVIPLLLGILFFSSFILVFIPSKNSKLIKIIAVVSSFSVFVLSLFLWLFFDNSYSRFQFVYDLAWLPASNLTFSLGVDGISLFLLLLTTLLCALCILSSWDSVSTFHKEYYISFLVMEALLVLVFCVRDLLLFYIFFESVLIPMFVIIGLWGSRERKVRAAYMFFLYTLLGSVLMLLSILYIYSVVGSTDYEALLTYSFSFTEQKILFLAFFASFA